MLEPNFEEADGLGISNTKVVNFTSNLSNKKLVVDKKIL